MAMRPLLQDTAKKAEQEAATARKEGASASATDIGEEQEGRERAARDAPPSKRLRGPVSAAKHEAVLPGSRMAAMHDSASCAQAGTRKAAPVRSGARGAPAAAPGTAGAL